ncbi:SH3 domain-binding protein 1 [Podarcis raffonei]|uniref:SH3 domain-binding protein 1 n=1 Tax=Podarcis raffonei TaxID=65483 RepID=UPI0023294B80|nr:SH3 domain-binding protein 1 [Podarcis raffonei]
MMKRQFNRMRQQLSHPSIGGRAQETAEYLTEDLLQIEQRIEPAKRAAHNVQKRLLACLQGQYGADMDKRVKKLPLMALSMTMAESFKELDTDSNLGKALEMSCFIQTMLARILAEFEMALERDVLQPLNKLSEEELPTILKHKKNLQKHISDWNAIKSRLNQAAKNSSNNTSGATGPGPSSAAIKLENLKEEEEEMKRRVEQSKDEYMADLYHFSTKEDSYAKYFIKLMEIQAEYHRKSLESLDTTLAEVKETHNQPDSPFPRDAAVVGVYGMPLETHLKASGREIAVPIEACVMMLLASGMKEEGLFRLAAGASVLKKLKYSLACGSGALGEFYADPHAVAGALKCYLRELPQPLMTFELYDDWLKTASIKEPENRLEHLRDTCSRLPKDNYNNMRYLIRFLAKLAEQQEVNKMTPSNIAIVLGPNLLWPQQTEGCQVQLDMASVSSIQVVGVVEPLIQNADILFPGDIDFDVSGLFTPPSDIKDRDVSAAEEPASSLLSAEPASPRPGESPPRPSNLPVTGLPATRLAAEPGSSSVSPDAPCRRAPRLVLLRRRLPSVRHGGAALLIGPGGSGGGGGRGGAGVAAAVRAAGRSMADCKRLSGSCLREVLGEAQGILFDCDGVLWTGERAVPGAPELLERLSRNGKAALFVSNNSRRSVPELERRFSRLGFRGVRAEQVFSSALCSALYLRQRLLGGESGSGDSPPAGCVFVLGGEGLRGELRDAGLRLAGEGGGGDDDEEDPAGHERLPVRAVVVGYDDQFTFAKLTEACAYLRDPQCLLVATDPDPWHPLSSGQRTPGTGSLTAAVETASGRKAMVIGKPNTYMFECIVERFGVDPSRMLMVGDRLETDILFGKNCGLETVLTLTGVSNLEEAQAYMASDSPAAKDLVPHYYVDSIADLIPGLDE